jgi:hypothetical protein
VIVALLQGAPDDQIAADPKEGRFHSDKKAAAAANRKMDGSAHALHFVSMGAP